MQILLLYPAINTVTTLLFRTQHPYVKSGYRKAARGIWNLLTFQVL